MRGTRSLAPLCLALAFAPLVLAGKDPPPDPLVRRLDGLRDAALVAPVASQALLRIEAGDARAGELLFAVARAWFRAGQAEASLAALERLGQGFPDWSGLAWLGMAEVHLERGAEEAALAALRRATAAPARDTRRDLMDASNTLNQAYWKLGGLLERREEWREAVACYEAWQPRSWCGNCGDSLRQARQVALARCRFRLGEVEPALAALREQASLEQWSAEGAALWLELAARAGRLDEAREQAQELLTEPEGEDWRSFQREERARRLPVALALAEGLAARAPGAILDALRPLAPADTQVFPDGSGHVDLEWSVAGRLLGELGASELLRARIGLGDEHAIVLAGLSGLGDLIPALVERLCLDRTGRVAEALERLGRATPPR